MPSTSTTLRIPLAAALRHPGNARPVVAAAQLADLSGVAAEVTPGSPVAVDLMLERVPEGIVVRGTVTARWSAACSRCLEPVTGEISVHVDELFETQPLEGETYQLDDDVIDLEPMVRDALLLELPARPVVRRRLRGPLPDVRRQPQPDAAATASPTRSTPAGRPSGRSSCDLTGVLRWPSRSAR